MAVYLLGKVGAMHVSQGFLKDSTNRIYIWDLASHTEQAGNLSRKVWRRPGGDLESHRSLLEV